MSTFYRQSNFELLKVISIVMVLILHYFNADMGGGLKNVPPGNFNYYAMYYIESLSIIAVNCFILLSGYFMIGKSHVKLRKAINLLSITVFYGVFFYIYNAILQTSTGNEWFSLRDLVNAFEPLLGSNWFVGSYVILFLLSPFINKVLNQLSKKQFTQLLVIIVFWFSLVPTLLPIVSYNDGGYGVLSFVMFYCIGAYLKIYQYNMINNKWTYITIYLVSAAITFVFGLYFEFAFSYNTIFNLISAVCLFQFFSKISLNSKVVNFFATFTFPIYIIHTDKSLKQTIFHHILNTEQFWDSKWFLLHLIVSVVIMFFGCIAIEIFRRFIFSFFRDLLKFKALDNIKIGKETSSI